MKLVLRLVLLLALVAGGLYLVNARRQAVRTPQGTATALHGAPPADAVYLPDDAASPDDLVLAVLRPGADPRVRASQFLGQWVAEPGWEGRVESVTPEGGTDVLTVVRPLPAAPGSGYSVLVAVQRDPEPVQAGDYIRFQGAVAAITQDAEPPARYRVRIEPARILDVRRASPSR